MARIKGPGIDPKGSYSATPAWGRGFYRVELENAPEAVLDGFMTIKISQEAARRLGRHKLPGETLAQAVERLALAFLSGKTLAGGASVGVQPIEGGRAAHRGSGGVPPPAREPPGGGLEA